MRILLPLLAALATPAPVVLAAEPAPAPGLEETLVVTGSRIESPPEAIPAHVTIIDRATIEARQPQSTLDLLRSVAGLQVSQYGGRGGITSVFIRGAEPNFTVVLIDGVQVNDPNNSRGGSFDFSTLNVAEIERIEIVRGAQSSLYGSDALAGVIQIITRKPEGTARVSIDAEAGEDEFYRGALHLAGALGESTQASFTASAADDGNAIDGNSFENRTLSGRLSSTPTQALSLALAARYADSEATAFPEDSGGPDLAVLRALDSRDQTQLSLNGTAGYQVSGRVRLSAQLGFVNHDEKTASPGIAPGVRDGVPPNRSESELERFSAALSATAQLSASADAVVGVDYEDESGSLDGTLELAPGFALPTDFNLDRHILGLFVELRAAPTDALALSASVRHDDPSSNDSETTGRLGAQVQVGATRLFASWSEGFKLPSFFALGHALVGNPDLKPEKSTSWEAGLSQSALDDRVNLTAALFRAEYEDLIDFDFDLFTNVNRSQVDTQGFEVALGLRPLDVLRLDAHLTYVDIDVKDSATTLRQRPDWRGGISAVWDLAPTVALTADWLYVDDSFDSSVPTGNATLDGYNRVDLSISWKPTETLRLWAAVDNLFDEDYEEAIGFPALGSRWRAGIRWSL